MGETSQNHGTAFYRRRDPFESPLWQVVDQYYDEFERVYPERYEKRYGYWRPVIGDVVGKYLLCGDLREGFARVHCTGLWQRVFCPIFL